MYAEDASLDRKKGHKRIVSMKEPEFSKHSLLAHSKDPQSELAEQIAGFEALRRHDKCKKEYTECSPGRKKQLSKAEFDSMVDRLYTYWKVYKDRNERRRYKYEEDQLEVNTFRPSISENSKNIMETLSRKHLNDAQSAKYLPIYKDKRLKEIENHKKLKLEKIREEQQQRELERIREEDEILKIVAEKTSASKFNHKEFLDNLESNLKHYMNKKDKEREERESKYSDITFTPSISKKSKELIKKKQGAKTFRERQIEFEERNKEKRKKLLQQ